LSHFVYLSTPKLLKLVDLLAPGTSSNTWGSVEYQSTEISIEISTSSMSLQNPPVSPLKKYIHIKRGYYINQISFYIPNISPINHPSVFLSSINDTSFSMGQAIVMRPSGANHVTVAETGQPLQLQCLETSGHVAGMSLEVVGIGTGMIRDD
jgi:hypothetical protein